MINNLCICFVPRVSLKAIINPHSMKHSLHSPVVLMTTMALCLAVQVNAQSNPSPRSIPYAQDFTSLVHGSTTYPAGWAGWRVSASVASSFPAAAPTTNRALQALSSAANPSDGLHNYNGRLGIMGATTVNPALALSINTNGKSNVEVSFKAGTLRNPYDGGANTRIHELGLQYRIGTSGTFTNVPFSTYRSGTVRQMGAGVTTPVDEQVVAAALPSACNNRPVVQLRWVVRNVSGAGAFPSFSLDDISVTTAGACTRNLIMELSTDANAAQTSWELRRQANGLVVCHGSGYPGPANITATCCVQDGCYRLRVLDAGGDGIVNGGYRLMADGQVVIDNRGNFSSGSVSAIIGNGGFCLPLGTDKLIYTSCDKLDWVNDQYLVAAENPAVSAQWGVGDQSDDGYQFWIYDPNGTYGYAKFRSHASSDGYGNVGATRACHMRINNWTPAAQIPQQTLMNVRVRSRVNGVNSNWGPACRFKVDPVQAACPLTRLMDIPGHPHFSCGVTREWGGTDKVQARPVSGATKYQFRFRMAGEGVEVVRTSNTYMLTLNWGGDPLVPGFIYTVDVRAFKNGDWCTSGDSWGESCTVAIAAEAGSKSLDSFDASGLAPAFHIFPNPSNDGRVNVVLDHLDMDADVAAVEVFDVTGQLVDATTVPVALGRVDARLQFMGLTPGVYLVTLRAAGITHTERLLIER